MIIHRPPDPRERVAYLLAPVFLWGLWLVAAIFVRHPVMDRTKEVMMVNFVLAPPLGFLVWHWIGPRRFRVARAKPPARKERGGRGRGDGSGARYAIGGCDEGVFNCIVEGGDPDAPVPAESRVPCLRRPAGAGVLVHPMMILQYVCVAVEIGLEPMTYIRCLTMPAVAICTIITLTWLAVSGTAWNVLEIRDGKAWIDDVEKGALRGYERERITAAGPTEDGIFVVLERQGKVRLWFPGGSLPVEVQRDIALDALRGHGGVTVSSEGGDARTVESEEVSS